MHHGNNKIQMTQLIRTPEAIETQSKQLLMLCYEEVNGQNLYGHPPQKMPNYVPYQKAKRRAMFLCRKYKDLELLKFIKSNL